MSDEPDKKPTTLLEFLRSRLGKMVELRSHSEALGSVRVLEIGSDYVSCMSSGGDKTYFVPLMAITWVAVRTNEQ